MNAAIVCSKLTKRYDARPPVDAVRGVDLTVEVGECFGLLGPNGAGKTTTMEILEGLLDATSGQVEILGHQWGRDAAAIRQLIGISLQDSQLLSAGADARRGDYSRFLGRQIDLLDQESFWRAEAAAGGRAGYHRRSAN